MTAKNEINTDLNSLEKERKISSKLADDFKSEGS